MFFKQILMDDAGALSYIIGCPGDKKACVVNPKADISEYIDTAAQYGMQITEIFETPGYTQRLSGKDKLAAITGARIYFLQKKEKPGEKGGGTLVKSGTVFRYGDAEVRTIKNSRYAPFSKALLVIDHANTNKPWLVLTRRSLIADNLGDDASGKDLGEKLTDYLNLYEPEVDTGLTDNMATFSRNMFHTSRTELAHMSLPR